MRAADLVQQSVKKYRRSINPPYNRRDVYSILGTVLILLILPLTVVAILTVRGLGVPAKGPPPEYLTTTREFFDEKGNLIASEVKRLKLSGKPEAFVNGEREKDIIPSNNVVVVDTRPEKDALKNYIIVLDTKSLGEKNVELKKAKVSKSSRVNQLKSSKKAIASEHKIIKSAIAKATGKKLVKANPKKGQRRAAIEFDTTLNGLVVELLPKEVAKVKKIKGVKRVVKEVIAKITLDSSVPMIHADEAWPFVDGKGAPLTGYGIKIGIIDTGVDYNHADLGGCYGTGCKVEGGWDFINNDSNPMDDHGHGTHVAATAAGRGTLLGVAPDANVYSYKVCNSSGSCPTSGTIAAIDRCVDPNLDGDFSDHLDVCSMSLGGSGNPDSPSALASDNAMNNGVTITISAGNSGPSSRTIGTPGTSREAITVGAACKPEDVGGSGTCSTDIASFSSRGPVVWTDLDGNPQEMVKPDIVAPGVNICAAEWDDAWASRRCKDEKHVAISGTSMAAPHAAGMAALLRQAALTAAPADIKTAMKSSAVAYGGFDENTQGKGLIHTMEALKFLSPDMDFSSKLYSKPFSWNITADLSGNTFTKNQTFTVTNNTESATTATISSENVPTGLTITSDKSSISVPAGGTATFNATLTGDNLVLVSGGTHVANIVVDSAVKKLYIAVLVRVPNRISVSESVDFGVDPPDFTGVWTSTKNAQVTNLQDIAGTYNLTAECCWGPNGQVSSGIGVTLSISSLPVAGGATASFSATASVDNSLIPNGIYTGDILVSSAQQLPVRIPFTISKYYRLIVTYSGARPNHISFHNQNSIHSGHFLGSNDSLTFLLDEKHPIIDVIGIYKLYSGDPGGPGMKFVVKEDITFDGDETVNIDSSIATIKYTTNYTGVNGENINPLTHQMPALKFKNNGLPAVSYGYSNFGPLSFYFNQISADYAFSVAAYYKYTPATSDEVRKGINFEYIDVNGFSTNKTFSNTASDLKLVPVLGYPNNGEETAIFEMKRCVTAVRSVHSCNGLSSADMEMQKANDYRYDLYTLPVDNVADIAQVLVYQRPELESESGSRLVVGTGMLFDSSGILRWPYGLINVGGARPYGFYDSTNNQRIDLGVLPYEIRPVWVMRDEFKYVNYIIKSQEHAYPIVYDFSYTVLQDGVKIGEGKLSKIVTLTDLIGNTPGDYVVEISGTPVVNDITTTLTMKGEFTIPEGFDSLQDAQPPSVNGMDFLSDNIPSPVIDIARDNIFRLDVLPTPAPFGEDSITTRILRMKTDVSDWQDLSSGDTFPHIDVTVPIISGASLYTFELVAVDNFNNKLTYSFQVPTGTVPGGGEPPGKPGDINGDGVVNIFDASILASSWGTNDPDADLNGNGVVDIFDASIMASNWDG